MEVAARAAAAPRKQTAPTEYLSTQTQSQTGR